VQDSIKKTEMRKKKIRRKQKNKNKICLIIIGIQALMILENKTKKEISSQKTDFRTQFLQ
jgi:hypothetical protein